MPPAILDLLAETANRPQMRLAEKQRALRAKPPAGLVAPFVQTPRQNLQLDPMHAGEVPAWEAANKPKFPIEPGKYGAQLAKDVQEEFLPSPTDTEDQTIYKVGKGLFGLGVGGNVAAQPIPGMLSAVKGKGGMWHPKATEDVGIPLYNTLVPEARGPGYDSMRMLEKEGRGVEGMTAEAARDKPFFDWTNKSIRNYLNKYAGTADDPLKDIQIPHGEGTVRWEDATDGMIYSKPVSEVHPELPQSVTDAYIAGKIKPEEPIWTTGAMHENLDREYQAWLKKEGLPQMDIGDLYSDGRNNLTLAQNQHLEEHFLPRFELAYNNENPIKSYMAHVGDYLREHVPATELPRYDLVRAVRETKAWDERMAKDMAKAEAEKAHIGVAVQKEYPDKYKWVEVQSKEALDHEGKTMGHCVGSYCDMVKAGNTKIFSLRDPKGGSHVTVEVRPGQRNEWLLEKQFAQWKEAAELAGLPPREINFEKWKANLPPVPPTIEQIKGKQNRAPVKEYLPYVQDFVKSGKWGDVEDVGNAGLVDLQQIQRGGVKNEHIAFEKALLEKYYPGQRYVTNDEYDAIYESPEYLAKFPKQ